MNSPSFMDHLRVVLVATRNPLNIGAAARAMSNFGCTHLRLVNPYDPAYREAVSAVGAAPVLANAEQFPSVAAAVADCTLVVGTTAAGRRELHHQLCTLESAARLILQRLARQPAGRAKKNRVALLFGSEKTGLSNDDLSHCHWLLRIPTRQEHRSMNLGQAVAVCLYELARDPKAAAKFSSAPEKSAPATVGKRARNTKAAAKFAQALEKETPATAGEIERFTAVLTEALSGSGFLDRRTVADADQRIRRIVRRLHLPHRDADMWTGIMRQIVWKLNAVANPNATETSKPSPRKKPAS
jgi:TrmH family RNA methyltransferase